VSCSSEVVPEIREYERTSSTCANVCVMLLMSRYLDDLERRLQEHWIPERLHIILSGEHGWNEAADLPLDVVA
jgi:N-methylhydantoinase A